MEIDGICAVVSGGASGLGLATVRHLYERGAHVVVADLETSNGQAVADSLGDRAQYVAADVTDERQVEAVLDAACDLGPLRVLVHTAGIGGSVRLVERDGSPGSLDRFRRVIDVNLVGTFNVLRLAAARMAANNPLDGDRGVCVLTASVAAYEGQIGQAPYSASKAGVVGMTLVAARDLARKAIRVCTIAPGTFDTPLLSELPEPVRESLAGEIPHPSRLGAPDEFAALAVHVIENPMLNGETIRLDGAIRMAPR